MDLYNSSLIVLVLIYLFIYLRGKCNCLYWKRRGVKFHYENKVLGPFWDFVMKRRPFFQILNEIYLQYPNDPVIGFGTLFTPSLYVKDSANVQFVTKSLSFSDRGFEYNHEDQLADNVLFMSGTRWKLMRQKMTPLFTSAKLKNMFFIMDKCSQDFIEYLQSNPDKRKARTFDTLTTFCCAAMSGSVFGVSSKEDFTSPFLEAAKNSFHPSLWKNLKFSISHLSPMLFKILNLKFFKEYEDFFFNAMKQVFKLSDQENVNKTGFADVCLSIKREGVIKDSETGYKMDATDELLSAQAFFFFAAGAEPSATALFGALIALGQHPEIEKRVQEEINNIFLKYNGVLTFDAITEMEYLEKVLCESLRMYPPIGYLTRKCIEDTVLPVGNIRIEKGTKVFFPVYEYHHDPQFFKNPEVFDPERFSEEAKRTMGVTYMPFGFGQRVCIGLRYARLQVKSALVHILRNFDLKTRVYTGGLKYGNDQVQLRMKNVDVELIQKESFK